MLLEQIWRQMKDSKIISSIKMAFEQVQHIRKHHHN